MINCENILKELRYITHQIKNDKDYKEYFKDKVEFDTEPHFSPLNITDIVVILIKKKLKENSSVLHSEIIFDFIKLLYNDILSYCIIDRAYHQYIHFHHDTYSYKLYGNLDKFIERYKDVMSESDLEKINKYKDSKKGSC